MSNAFVARQPIFDRESRLEGYELLYRPTVHATTAGTTDALRMSSATLVNSILGIGLDQLTGGARAFVNFPRELLLERDFELLDPARWTIELLETVDCDEETIDACRALRAKGFTLALDDFAAGEEYDPILALAQIVKLDVLGKTEEDLIPVIARLAPFKVQLLAERVEDAATYAMCRRLGFTMFQGHHFSRPEIVQSKDLPVAMLGITRLMKMVLDTNTSDRDLEMAFRGDPALSFKLLRIVNSAAMGGKGIESIQQAIRMIGRAPLHRWLSLLFATSVPRATGVQQELVLAAMERGRLCEMIAERSGRRSAAAPLFLSGLLSTFDVILGVPMATILSQVSVSAEVEAALLREEGPYTPFLTLATRYARGDFDAAIELASEMGLVEELPVWYAEAAGWAREALSRN